MSREAQIVRTLVELADNLIDDFDVIDVLNLLSDRCVTTFDVAAAGVMLATPTGELQLVASSSETMRVLELLQLQAHEGPCVDCYRSGQAVVNAHLAAGGEEWTKFTPRALAEGFQSVHSLPMRLRNRTIGALNMFRTDEGDLGEADIVAAQALADVATITILQHRTVVDAETVNNQLNQALNSRIIIEQAKGTIGQATGVDMDQAFQRIRNHARRHNLRLTDLCRAIAERTITPYSLDPIPKRKQTQ